MNPKHSGRNSIFAPFDFANLAQMAISTRFRNLSDVDRNWAIAAIGFFEIIIGIFEWGFTGNCRAGVYREFSGRGFIYIPPTAQHTHTASSAQSSAHSSSTRAWTAAAERGTRTVD